jgi:hypothetical protein
MNSDPNSLPHSKTRLTAQLDLAIPNMDGEADEKRASRLLAGLPGIAAMRIVARGAFIHYAPDAITKEQISHAFHQAGFRASVFQDSHSHETGRSSQ